MYLIRTMAVISFDVSSKKEICFDSKKKKEKKARKAFMCDNREREWKEAKKAPKGSNAIILESNSKMTQQRTYTHTQRKNINKRA